VSPWAPCYTGYKGVVSNQAQTQRSVSTVHTSTVIIRWIHFPVSRNEVTKQGHLIPLKDPCAGSKRSSSKPYGMEESIEASPHQQSIRDVEVEPIHVHTGLLTGVVKIQLALIPLTKAVLNTPFHGSL
jgi:hypothetical protein